MSALFLVAAAVAVAATAMVITRRDAVHALLYLVVSLLAVAVVMLLLGAVFVAALEVIVYAGAIMVLFIFVIMMIGPERGAVKPSAWIGPAILAVVLLAELVWIIAQPVAPGAAAVITPTLISPQRVGFALIGPYLLASEVAVFLLLAGLLGAFHLGRRQDGHPWPPPPAALPGKGRRR
jgi:NADH-quinone oxidoreductase subunit J